MGDADLAGRPPTPDPVGGPGPASMGPDGRGSITAGSQEQGPDRRAPLGPASFLDATAAGDARSRLAGDVAAARAEVDGAIDDAIGRRNDAARAARQHRSDRWARATGSSPVPAEGLAGADDDPAGHAIGPIDLRDGTGAAGDVPAPTGGGQGPVVAPTVSVDDVGDDAAFDRFWSEVVGERPARHRLRRWVDRAVP